MAVKSLKEGVILNGKSHSYRIDKVLGSGTFGITYLADVLFHNNMTSNTSVKVAIKEFFMKDFNDRQGSSVTIGSKDGFFGKYLEKFIKEADKLSKIKSNGVVKVLEAFKANNTAYYVMQFLPGGSLNSLITDNGYLPEGVALQFSLQIATALEDLHSQKMLHLDLKPSNVMLTGDYKAVLIDFGLSKQYSDNGEPESSTTIGAGTKGYAPIEQANYRDQGDFPVTMDIYAFGATIFKMVSGVVPPDSSSILNDGFPKEILKQKRVSPALIDFIECLMAPMKKSRPQNMKSVISELRTIGNKIGITSNQDVIRWVRRNSKHEEEIVDDAETEIDVVAVEKPNAHQWKQKDDKHHKSETSDSNANFDGLNDSVTIDSIADKICFTVHTDPNKPNRYEWISITATRKGMTLVTQRKGAQLAEKKSFFYSPQKFDNLLERIKSCNISAISSTGSQQRDSYGVGLTIYDADKLLFSASSFEDNNMSLVGDLDKLTSIAWKESGLISLDSIAERNNPLSRMINFLRSPKKWIGYAAIIIATFWVYYSYYPISSYITGKYKTDLIMPWEKHETNQYQLIADYEGVAGIYHKPTKNWILNQVYQPLSDPNIYPRTYIIDILDQEDDYGLIKTGKETGLYYKGELIKTLPLSKYGSIHFTHKKGIYEITSQDIQNSDYIRAIYDRNGNAIIPFDAKMKKVLSNNIIEVYNSSKVLYYDLNGKEISSFNIVIIYERYGNIIDFLSAIIISLILCLVSHIIYRLYNKRKNKKSASI